MLTVEKSKKNFETFENSPDPILRIYIAHLFAYVKMENRKKKRSSARVNAQSFTDTI